MKGSLKSVAFKAFLLAAAALSAAIIIAYYAYINFFMEDRLSVICACKRPSFYSRRKWIMQSSCSDVGTFFHGGQNVVSFSMHLTKQEKTAERAAIYRRGIALNLINMRIYYPGYSMRIYSDEEPTKDSDFCKLWCHNPDLFWCDVRRSPSLGDISKKFYMLWRFTALGDPTVDTFLSRDLDSVITPREVGAVNDWLNLSKPFHSMRDKEVHCGVVMLGGMWGARNTLINGNLGKELQGQLLDSTEAYKGLDQGILQRVFGSRTEDIVAHDSYCCDSSPFSSTVRPFPTKRLNSQNDFVGNPEFGGGNYGLQPCPEACRPSYGKNWTYC